MTLIRLGKLLDYLTLERARTYAWVTMLMLSISLIAFYYSEPGAVITRTDFPAFYVAGTILNEGGALYDAKLQESQYSELERLGAPDPQSIRYFAYTPFFALFFKPLARLPYFVSFICWSAINTALFLAGFWMVWAAANLPTKYRLSAFIVAMSWLPVFAWTILFGQTSIFGFFVLAFSTFLLSRGGDFGGGLALSLLLYKPPLMILIVPMLLVTRRWRTLIGVSIGALILGLVSLWIIGFSGAKSYLQMLKLFSELKANGGRPTLLEVDLYSFFFSLSASRNLSIAFVSVIALVLVPILIWLWFRRPPSALQLAVLWTIVLNFYMLLYDMTLLVVPVVLSFAFSLTPSGLPRVYRLLLLLMFVVPWLERLAVARTGFQIITPVIVALGIYQMSLVCKASNNKSVETTPTLAAD